MSVVSIQQLSLRPTKPICAIHCPVLGMVTAFFMLPQAQASSDDLRIQSELGQKFRAHLRLSQRELNNEQSTIGNYGSDCFRATMRSVDGNLIANLAVERNGSGISLQSAQIIEEPTSRVSVRNICPEGGSREFAVLLTPTHNNKLVARKSGAETTSTNLGWLDSRAGSLDQSAAQARLAERAARLAQAQEKMKALAAVGQTPSPAAAVTAASHSSTSSASISQDNIAPSEASNSASINLPNSNLASLERQISSLEQRIAQLRAQDNAETPNPIGNFQSWTWTLALLVCCALAGLLGLLLYQRKLRALSPANAQPHTFARMYAPNSTLQTSNTLTRTTSIMPLPEELSNIEYQTTLIEEDEFDFGVGLGEPESWPQQTKPKPHNLAADQAPQAIPQVAKKIADQNLDDEDFLFANELMDNGKLLEVEEMTDALQEAKFWQSLQRPQSAIEVLEEELRQDKKRSPSSWIYLLDLYRQVHEREKFESLRARFHRIFNGQIPAWDEELELGKIPRLMDFPRITEKLAEVLPTDLGLPYLESLLVDDREGTREGFAYGVYCDLVQLLENVKQGKRELVFS